MFNRILLSLVVLVITCNSVYAQDEPQSIYHEKYNSIFSSPGNVVSSYQKRIKNELSISRPSHDSLSFYYLVVGRGFYELKQYDSVYPNFHKAYLYAVQNLNSANPDQVILSVAEFFSKSTEENFALTAPAIKNETSAEIYFKVRSILKQKNDTSWVELSGGEFDGLFKGAAGEAIGVYNVEAKDRGSKSLGKAEVLAVSGNSATVLVNLVDTSDWKSLVNTGDMVRLPVITEKKSYKSIICKLAQLNIDFTSNEGKPFYHVRQFLFDDNQESETYLLQLMCNEIIATANLIKPQIPDNPQWDISVQQGKYQGEKMVDVMASVTPDELRSFLDFVLSFPGKYMGLTWRISETYATWIINNTPLGETDMRSLLFSAKNNMELDTVFARYKTDIVGLEMQIRLAMYAQDSTNYGKYKQAFIINYLLNRMADFYKDENWKAWAVFSRAKIFDSQEKYEEAVSTYLEAKEMFLKVSDISGQAFALNNIASIFNTQGKYNEALKYYEESYQLKLEVFKTDSSDNTITSVSNSLVGKGLCFENLSRYSEAIETYQSALNFLVKSNSFSLATQRADLYKSIGKTQKKLGNIAEARKQFERALSIKHELGDRAGEAGLLDDLAYYVTENTAEANSLYWQAYQIKLDLGDKSGAGFSMSNAAQTHWTLGEYEKAINAHHLALKLRAEANDRSGQAYSYSKLGALYKESGEPNKAIENYYKAIEIYKVLGKKKEVAEIYSDLGANYQKVKDYEKALVNYTEAMKIYEEIEAKTELASCYSDLASVYLSLKDYNNAKENEYKALKIQKDTGDKEGQMYAYLTLGLVALTYDYKPDSALADYQNALTLAVLTDSKLNIAYCKLYIARLKKYLGKTEEAAQLFGENLKTYQELNDKTSEAEVLIELGYLKLNTGDFKAAEEYYSKAIALAQSSNDNYNLNQAIISQSELERLKGNYKVAIELANQALVLNRKQENFWGIAVSNLVLGNINNQMGEYKTALTYYHIADSLYTALGVEMSKATPLNNIGTIYFGQGNYDEALPYIMKAHEIITKSGVDIMFLSLLKSNIGEIYYETKKYDEAKKWLNDGANIARELNSYSEIFNALSVLAKLNFDLNNWEEAKANLDEIFKVTANSQEKVILIQKDWLMGKYYLHQKDYANAEKYLLASIKNCKEIGSSKYLWEPLYYLASLQKTTGKTDSAIITLKETIVVIETLKNKVAGGAAAQKLFASGDTKVVVYSDIVELLIQQGRIEEALQYLERGNNENLKTKFKGLNVTFNDSTKNEAISKEKELKNKLDLSDDQIIKEKSKPQAEQNEQLIRKLEEIKTVHQAEYISFVNQVVTQEPTLKNYFSKSENPINFRAQKKNIPADMAVLLYLFSNDNLYIFAGTADSVVAKAIKIDKPALEKKIAAFCVSLKTPSFSSVVRGSQILDADHPDATAGMETFKKNSEDLYNILIQPVEDVIKGKTKLAIIPNGSLYYIPFQVLGQETDKGFQYLISDYSVFYSNKLSYLFDNLFRQDNSPKILAIGNADKTLPFAEEEVKGLKTIFTGSKILLQEEATKSAVLTNQGGYTIIHFATHGILDYNNFEKSYLVLAKDATTGDDGKFKIDDIYGINNLDQCEMVTLSACETAVTLESSQGWPITTASAFLEIGVPTVIASLWSVDDKATGILMNKFYENLKKMSKLEALQSAQKSLLSDTKFNHPYYWAPFLLVGNWK